MYFALNDVKGAAVAAVKRTHPGEVNPWVPVSETEVTVMVSLLSVSPKYWNTSSPLTGLNMCIERLPDQKSKWFGKFKFDLESPGHLLVTGRVGHLRQRGLLP